MFIEKITEKTKRLCKTNFQIIHFFFFKEAQVKLCKNPDNLPRLSAFSALITHTSPGIIFKKGKS